MSIRIVPCIIQENAGASQRQAERKKEATIAKMAAMLTFGIIYGQAPAVDRSGEVRSQMMSAALQFSVGKFWNNAN